MVSKNHELVTIGTFHPGNCAYYFHKSVPFFRWTVAEAWNWYLIWLSRNGTRISVWNMPSGKTETPFRIIRFSRNFSLRTIRKVAFLLLSNRIFWKSQFGRRDTGHQQYHTLKYWLKSSKQKDETISNFPQYGFMILFIRRLSSHRT